MGFGTAVKTCFSKYITFSGRASRSEFWWFGLFNLLGTIVTRALDWVAGTAYHMTGPSGTTVSMGYGYIYSLYALAILLPAISVIVRRLHDRDRSGWWYWLIIVPVVGAIWLLVWFCRRGTAGDNRFGPDSVAAAASPPPSPA